MRGAVRPAGRLAGRGPIFRALHTERRASAAFFAVEASDDGLFRARLPTRDKDTAVSGRRQSGQAAEGKKSAPLMENCVPGEPPESLGEAQ